MERYTLDTTDLHILSLLQHNSRITNAELAKTVGLSQPPCLRRVKLLETHGYITRYTTHINEEKCGFSVMVFAFVRLKSQTKDAIDNFCALIDTCDMIRESYIISGENDFILRIIAPDWTTYRHFLKETLMTAPDVSSIRSNLCVRQQKSVGNLPI